MQRRIPPTFVTTQDAFLAQTVWMWITWAMGRPVTVQEIEDFLRAPAPQGLGADAVDADPILTMIVKYQAREDAVVRFKVRGKKWVPAGNSGFGLKGTKYEDVQAALVKYRTMAVGETYRPTTDAELNAWTCLWWHKLVGPASAAASRDGIAFAKKDRPAPRWFPPHPIRSCRLVTKFPSLAAGAPVVDPYDADPDDAG